LDTAVADIIPDFTGQRPIQPYENPLKPGTFVAVTNEAGYADAGQVTFRHLLTHTSGLPAWRPLYQFTIHNSQFTIHTAVTQTFFSYPTGQHVIYSDLGLILLGWAIEHLTGRSLRDEIETMTRQFTTAPIQFGPVAPEQVPPTEFCSWREKRMRGEVHDENAWAMGGVAGHAGLFGTATAVADLGQAWLNAVQGGGLLPQALAQEAVSLQAEDGAVRRGLGWALWSPLPESASHPLSQSTFGHTGFTGTSLHVDPERDMVVACLTNEVYNGRQNRSIGAFRVALHERTVRLVQSSRLNQSHIP
jgi:CubicO group peptidase (beta-lactamase class C family)